VLFAEYNARLSRFVGTVIHVMANVNVKMYVIKSTLSYIASSFIIISSAFLISSQMLIPMSFFQRQTTSMSSFLFEAGRKELHLPDLRENGRCKVTFDSNVQAYNVKEIRGSIRATVRCARFADETSHALRFTSQITAIVPD